MRLTPFEEFMHVDDRAAYPMVFFYRLRFAGTLDAVKLTRAVQDAARRQPLFASTVEKVETSRVEYYVWKPSDRRVPVVWEITADADADPHTPHIDITQEVGLRLFVTERYLESGVESGVVTDLLFQVHHACCDGIGMANFVEGVLQTYAAGDDDGSVEEVTRSLETVPRGDVARRRWWQWPFAFVLRLALLLRLALVYLRRAAPLVAAPPDFDAAAPPATFPSLRVRQLTREATQHILETSRQANVTVNDLLLAAAYRAASETNANDTRPIRLSIPVNLRTAAETNTVSNTVSMIFLDRHRAAIASPQRLLASVHRAMLWGKWLGDAETLLVGLRFTKWFPRLLPHVVRGRNRCWATVVVSNLGRLYTATPLPRSPRGEIVFGNAVGNAVGDAVLTRVELAPPIRGWTAAAIGIATYADAMTFTLNYDSSRMTRDEAERFLSQFVAYAEGVVKSTFSRE